MKRKSPVLSGNSHCGAFLSICLVVIVLLFSGVTRVNAAAQIIAGRHFAADAVYPPYKCQVLWARDCLCCSFERDGCAVNMTQCNSTIRRQQEGELHRRQEQKASSSSLLKAVGLLEPAPRKITIATPGDFAARMCADNVNNGTYVCVYAYSSVSLEEATSEAWIELAKSGVTCYSPVGESPLPPKLLS